MNAGEVKWILLRGDAHHDNPHCDHELERKHLDECVERDGLWLDVGDLFCAMGGKYDKRSRKEGIVRPENMVGDYFDSIVQSAATFYKPYASRCIALGQGNHETSVLDRNETDLTKRLGAAMGVHAGAYGGYVQFKEAHTSLTLKYFHGSGGGGMMSFDTLRVRRQASYIPDADVIVCGHVHEQWMHQNPRERFVTLNGEYRIDQDVQHHVRTGTYKDEYGDGKRGWHVERGGPPKAIGAVWMKIEHVVDHRGGRRKYALRPEFVYAR